ncbi:MAG: ATP-binding protein [Clostridia bacterium]|nr:ATP-binding protein [Clostridia bacterium]
MKFQVVGCTNQQEIFVASTQRKFNINEYLIIEDEDHNNPVGEVMETSSFNKFIPMVDEKSSILDDSVMKNLSQLGFDIDKETVHIAKVRMVGELTRPITVASSVRLPQFKEIEHIVMQKRPEKGLALGVIRGTENIQSSLPNELKNISLLYDKNRGIIPQQGIPFVYDYYALREYPHIGIFGGSGSGKSFGLRVILEELMKKRIPTLLLDPHFEMDFTQTFEGLPKDYIENFSRMSCYCTVGHDLGIKFEDLTSDELCNVLSSSKYITETMETAIKSIHQKNDSLISFTCKIERLIDAFEKGDREIEKLASEDPDARKTYKIYQKYKNSVQGLGTLKGIAWRLNALKFQGIFNYDISKVEEGLKHRKTVVVRGNINILKTIAGYLINTLYKKRRTYKDTLQDYSPEKIEDHEKFPPFVVVLDEAHNFSFKGDIMTPTKWTLREIAQEGRKYGVFLILASQRPALIDDTTVAQLNTKIIFRTVRSSDLDVIKEETDLSSAEIKRLPYLDSGNAFISSACIGRSVSVRFRVTKTKSPHDIHPFDELEDMDQTSKLKKILIDFLPLQIESISNYHKEINKQMGQFLTVKYISETLEEMEQENIIAKEDTPFGPRYIKK